MASKAKTDTSKVGDTDTTDPKGTETEEQKQDKITDAASGDTPELPGSTEKKSTVTASPDVTAQSLVNLGAYTYNPNIAIAHPGLTHLALDHARKGNDEQQRSNIDNLEDVKRNDAAAQSGSEAVDSTPDPDHDVNGVKENK